LMCFLMINPMLPSEKRAWGWANLCSQKGKKKEKKKKEMIFWVLIQTNSNMFQFKRLS
jgi:hypothetical protein